VIGCSVTLPRILDAEETTAATIEARSKVGKKVGAEMPNGVEPNLV
jgi:hypothetical protein